MTPAIRAVNATVTYGQRRALDDVSFEVAPGQSLALVGPNGSGKTTLLHLLAKITTPSSGSVSTASRTAACVLQYSGVGSWMPLTVEEVLRMGRYRSRGLLGRLRRDDQRLLSEAAARLEVEDLRARQFGELSGGQRQRVLVAQALAQGSSLLLMDEPITGLDMASQERILDVLDEETDRGHTVVISTHHLEEAHHCNLAAVLSGRLVAFGSPADVLNEEVLRDAYAHAFFGAHEGHEHPSGLLMLDDAHHHDHPGHGHR